MAKYKIVESETVTCQTLKEITKVSVTRHSKGLGGEQTEFRRKLDILDIII